MQSVISGYVLAMLRVASRMVKGQLTAFFAALRGASHAASTCSRVFLAGMRRSKHCGVRAASSFSAMFSQLPCFGV